MTTEKGRLTLLVDNAKTIDKKSTEGSYLFGLGSIEGVMLEMGRWRVGRRNIWQVLFLLVTLSLLVKATFRTDRPTFRTGNPTCQAFPNLPNHPPLAH